MDENSKPVIGIVIPWFGRAERGGAELHAWNLAEQLSSRGCRIEVLTTCCKSYHDDWSTNHHPAELTIEPEGFSVRRFPVENRNRSEFDRVCSHLLGIEAKELKPGVSPLPPDDEQIFSDHLIRCPALLGFLKSHGANYATFIFLPYLYGPILEGLPIVAAKSFLQPCLHDESYAYLRKVQDIFYAARGLLWISEGEFELGKKLFGPGIIPKSTITGAGVESIKTVLGDESESLSHLKPFLILLGRKDEGKGTILAAEAFRNFREQNPNSNLNLVIAGPGELNLKDQSSRIHDLGLVSENERAWLLSNAIGLLQPSPNESFSRVIFEAWQCRKPVVVRRTCLATSRAVQACSGGWEAEIRDEWTAAIARFDQSSFSELDSMGEKGQKYASIISNWESVMDRYDSALQPILNDTYVSLFIECTFESLVEQTISIRVGEQELGSWDLSPKTQLELAPIRVDISSSSGEISITTDTQAQHYGEDPRKLGFHLKNIGVTNESNEEVLLLFISGWNRSDTGPGLNENRWSTGNAKIRILDRLRRTPSIHQVLPNLAYGDAIGNHTIWIRNQLQEMGFISEIFARHISEEMLHEAHHYADANAIPGGDAVIYHHSIGSEITSWVCDHPGPKGLIYHNITPAEFFDNYRPDFAEILRSGRKELSELAKHFDASVGDSTFNASELAEHGFESPGVMPLCIEPGHWSYPPESKVMADLQDGRTNIIFVGRIVPNKRYEDLIYTFKFWLEHDPEARLHLVGSAEVSSFYFECIQELARRLRVDHAVNIVGRVNDAELNAYYRCASMFWCLSRHEGFCVPIIEACAFGVPVYALAAGAVPETLGDLGVTFGQDLPPWKIAELIQKSWLTKPLGTSGRQIMAYHSSEVSLKLEALIDQISKSAPKNTSYKCNTSVSEKV